MFSACPNGVLSFKALPGKVERKLARHKQYYVALIENIGNFF